jgi:predicted Zn-dependent protease
MAPNKSLKGKVLIMSEFSPNNESFNRAILSLFEEPNRALDLLGVKKKNEDLDQLSDAEIKGAFSQGVKDYESRRYKAASECFKRLALQHPAIPNFWVGLGAAQMERKKHDSALFALKMGILTGAGQISTYMQASHCALSASNPRHALEILEMGLQQADDSTSHSAMTDARKQMEAISVYLSVSGN